MRAKTRIFGEIDIPQDKIITMEKGMIGFSELKNYTLIYNSEKENDKKSIMWLQSMDDGDIAFPVMTPDIIMPDYKPTVNEELLAPLGDLNEENMYPPSAGKPCQTGNCSIPLPLHSYSRRRTRPAIACWTRF